jgi:hypothetical protein
MLKSFRGLRKLLTVVNGLPPLSFLARDGGDVRGGSFDSFWLRLRRAEFGVVKRFDLGLNRQDLQVRYRRD